MDPEVIIWIYLPIVIATVEVIWRPKYFALSDFDFDDTLLGFSNYKKKKEKTSVKRLCN
jgi:hypothetical protein